MIRFIYGAGSDATRQLLTESILQDLADGFQAILLVPEQETVITERRMLESLPATAQLSAGLWPGNAADHAIHLLTPLKGGQLLL